MKLIKTGLILLVGFIFFSCSSGRPIAKVPSDNNTTYKVDYLFEHEGCKVYRFYDNGHYVYFTNCNGESISIENDSTQTRITNTTKLRK
ncbi:MAG: DUF4884 domain-containing protein [Prevotella sp.]|jgi:hypothetical protein|nr:DUF4884 domain-containing protein [Prevotella sp.]